MVKILSFFITMLAGLFLGFSKACLAQTSLSLDGIYDLKGGLYSSKVIISQGRAFILNAGGIKVTSLNDQQLLWQREIMKDTHGNLALSQNGQLFVALSNGHVMAYDARSGGILWQIDCEKNLNVYTLAQPEGSTRLYVVSSDNQLMCLDTRQGKILWRYNGTPFVTVNASNLVDIPLNRPAVEGFVPSVGQVTYFADFAGKLVALAASSGKVLWSENVSRLEFDSLDLNLVKLAAPPLVLPNLNLVVTVGRPGPLEARHMKTGKLAWRFSISAIQPPVFWQGKLYLVSTAGKLIALDARSGQKEWSFFVNETLREAYQAGFWYKPSLLSPDNGKSLTLLLASNEGSLVLFDVKGKAECKAVYDVRYPASEAPTVVGNKVYLTTEKGDLVMMSAS